MTCKHGNKVNKLAELYLLHDILSPPRRTKFLNGHYYPILQECIKIQKGKMGFNNFQILLDSRFRSIIIIVKLIKNHS